jgi:hypothetical protein
LEAAARAVVGETDCVTFRLVAHPMNEIAEAIARTIANRAQLIGISP